MQDGADYGIGSDKWPGLGKLLEEMGELTQILGKLIGTNGETKYWNNADLEQLLYEELADVRATWLFFVAVNHLDSDRLAERTKFKLERFQRWHDMIKDGRHDEVVREAEERNAKRSADI